MDNINDKERVRVQIRIEPELAQKIDALKDEKGYNSRNILINDIFQSYFSDDSITMHMALVEQNQSELVKTILYNQQKIEYMLATLIGILSAQTAPAPEVFDNLDKAITKCLKDDREISQYNFKRIGKDCSVSKGANLLTQNQAPVFMAPENRVSERTPVQNGNAYFSAPKYEAPNEAPVNDDDLYGAPQNSMQKFPQAQQSTASAPTGIQAGMSIEDMCKFLNNKIAHGERLSPNEDKTFRYLYRTHPEHFGDEAVLLFNNA